MSWLWLWTCRGLHMRCETSETIYIIVSLCVCLFFTLLMMIRINHLHLSSSSSSCEKLSSRMLQLILRLNIHFLVSLLYNLQKKQYLKYVCMFVNNLLMNWFWSNILNIFCRRCSLSIKCKSFIIIRSNYCYFLNCLFVAITKKLRSKNGKNCALKAISCNVFTC